MSNDNLMFRVWDNALNHYRDEEFFIGRDGALYFLSRTVEPPELVDVPGVGDRFIMERCTGMKDRNGKLIFEGDVLHFPGITNYPNRRFVAWKHAAFFHADDNGSMFMLHPEGTKLAEIVGNVHENNGGENAD